MSMKQKLVWCFFFGSLLITPLSPGKALAGLGVSKTSYLKCATAPWTGACSRAFLPIAYDVERIKPHRDQLARIFKDAYPIQRYNLFTELVRFVENPFHADPDPSDPRRTSIVKLGEIPELRARLRSADSDTFGEFVSFARVLSQGAKDNREKVLSFLERTIKNSRVNADFLKNPANDSKSLFKDLTLMAALGMSGLNAETRSLDLLMIQSAQLCQGLKNCRPIARATEVAGQCGPTRVPAVLVAALRIGSLSGGDREVAEKFLEVAKLACFKFLDPSAEFEAILAPLVRSDVRDRKPLILQSFQTFQTRHSSGPGGQDMRVRTPYIRAASEPTPKTRQTFFGTKRVGIHGNPGGAGATTGGELTVLVDADEEEVL